jgi:hypothetical protein
MHRDFECVNGSTVSRAEASASPSTSLARGPDGHMIATSALVTSTLQHFERSALNEMPG